MVGHRAQMMGLSFSPEGCACIVGNSYLGITSGLPVNREPSRSLPTTRLCVGNCILRLVPHAFPKMHPVAEQILICG